MILWYVPQGTPLSFASQASLTSATSKALGGLGSGRGPGTRSSARREMLTLQHMHRRLSHVQSLTLAICKLCGRDLFL